MKHCVHFMKHCVHFLLSRCRWGLSDLSALHVEVFLYDLRPPSVDHFQLDRVHKIKVTYKDP